MRLVLFAILVAFLENLLCYSGVGIAYEFFRGNKLEAERVEVEAEMLVGRVVPVPAVDNNLVYVFERNGRFFKKAIIFITCFFEKIFAGDYFFAFGEDFCGIFAHIELTRCESDNALAEPYISALTAMIEHHTVSFIQTYY